MVNTKLYLFFFILLFVLLIVYFIVYNKFLFVLKKNHSEKWKELGSPTFIMNNSISNGIVLLKFLWNKEYLKTNDPELIKIAQLTWTVCKVYIMFIIIIALFFGGSFIMKLMMKSVVKST
jgi:hypothetical protein